MTEEGGGAQATRRCAANRWDRMAKGPGGSDGAWEVEEKARQRDGGR
jgi:hypothetical protein